MNHNKFCNRITMEDFKSFIEAEKNAKPQTIQYFFAFITTYPQYCVLGYFTPANKFIREFIKVKNKGYYFHEKYFGGMNQLVGYFKDNYNDILYRKYTKKAKSP